MPLRRKNDEPKNKPSPAKKGAKEMQKRKGRPDHQDDDDSSVDSHGNIIGLIDYESDDSEAMSSSWHESNDSPKKKVKKVKKVIESDTESEKETEDRSPPPKRKAALSAEKRIKKRFEEEEAASKIKAAKKADESKSNAVASPKLKKKEMVKEEDDAVRKKKKLPDEPPKRKSKKKEPEPESEEEEDDEDEVDDDEDDDDDEEDDDDDEDDDEEEDEDVKPRRGGIELLISDFGDQEYRPQKPKKYKLSKEPENVRRFVKLVQTEIDQDEEDIDRDIGYFKGLTPGAQDRLMAKLKNKIDPAEPTVPLKFQIMSKEVAPEVERVALAKYTALINIDPSTTEYYKASQWLHGYTQLPLGVYKDLPVKIEDGTQACQEFVSSVRKHMESAIFGHDEAKLQILQFVSSWIANPQAAGNVLSIHGPPGVGKTTLIKDGVAKALGRPFHFITLGGATDASFLDGHSYTYEGSTWGRIVDVLIKSKCMNPVIYFDELDKVSETPKGEEINNLLIHLTDGSQNDRFQDKYFTGIDLNLSRCLFIFSHNNHERVNPILRDRMYNIQVAGFSVKEKIVIAEQYLVSSALREVNLFEKIGINKDILTHIIESFTGEEKGVRELKRCIQTVISKVNLLRFYNDPEKVPFSIKGFTLPFTLKKEHVDLFLKKKSNGCESISHLYT